jgi:hypothetical protein
MARTEDQIDAELNDLDVPILDLIGAILLVGDKLEVDVLKVVRDYDGGIYPHKTSNEQLILDLVDEALESSFQVASIIRALELEQERSEL